MIRAADTLSLRLRIDWLDQILLCMGLSQRNESGVEGNDTNAKLFN